MSRISDELKTDEIPKKSLNKKNIERILFVGILILGIFSRVWEFGLLPPGLNTDEASIGVEAFSLLHYGIDRNGIPFPVHFIAWGSGQNALYGYLLIPFIALLGLRPVVIRLPMLISGIASLPLLYYAAKKTADEHFALLTMFLLAISPWHILLSRWGLESNIFPFVFLIGYICLLRIDRRPGWFVAACVLFGLCLYAYGTAYLMVPVFLFCAIIILAKTKIIQKREIALGLVAFSLVTIPIFTFIAVNTFGLNSIELGAVTIPRLPVMARYETETAIFSSQPFQAITANVWMMLKLLATQTDGIIYNAFEPYGYFYKLTFPFAAIGLVGLFHSSKVNRQPRQLLVVTWVAAALTIGVVQPANINRLNIIFFPLILGVAFSIHWLSNYYRPLLTISVCLFLIGFVLFTVAYHGEEYRQMANWKFHNGLLSALKFVRQSRNIPVCMTDGINMPYIFVLFSEQSNPENYLETIKYKDPHAPLREVLSLENYTFGKKNCPSELNPTYLLISSEPPPHLSGGYRTKFFDGFVVYYPKSN